MNLFINNLDGHVLEYGCRIRKDGHFIRWKAKARCITTTSLPYEISVSADGQEYLAFIGSYINGYYIAVPGMFKSADLSTPDDYIYNQGKLLEAGMDDFWAATFAQAFRVFDSALHENLDEKCKRAVQRLQEIIESRDRVLADVPMNPPIQTP